MGEPDEFLAIRKLLLAQVLMVAFVSNVALGFFGVQAGKSALLGGIIGFLPNACFAFKISGMKGKPANLILRSFYVGEALKLVLTAALFILVFQLPDILGLPLFAGFMAVLMVFWFALLMRSMV